MVKARIIGFHGPSGEEQNDITGQTIVYQLADADAPVGEPVHVPHEGYAYSYPKYWKVHFDEVTRVVANLKIFAVTAASGEVVVLAGTSETYEEPAGADPHPACTEPLTPDVHGPDNPLVIKEGVVIESGEVGFGDQPYLVTQLRVGPVQRFDWWSLGTYVIRFDEV